MRAPALPDNEAERLAALESLRLLYTPAEERFDRVTRIASQLFGTPIALVTFVAEKCQWFKSSHGLETPEAPREISFCGHAILRDEVFVVEDALADERFAGNPLVTGDPNIRFYAGHPICADDGSAIGTLCIIDREPRSFSQPQRDALRDLAALVETELHRAQLNDAQDELVKRSQEFERKASVDGLTRLWNREAIMRLLTMEVSRGMRGKPVSLAMIDVDHFKDVNDRFGHQTGDKVLGLVAACIRAGVRDFDAAGRYGGDEFMVVLGDCGPDAAGAIADRIRERIELAAIATGKGDVRVTVTIGVASHATTFPSVEAFVEAADQALYRAKKLGRNRVVLAGMEHPLHPPGMVSWRKRK